MKDLLKKYFTFNRKERNGIIVLLFLIFFVLIINFSIPFLVKEQSVDFTEFSAEIDSFLVESDNLEKTNNYPISSSEIKQAHPIQLFQFDPNNTSSGDFKKLGLRPKTISIIEKYLAKGGEFKKKEDFKKIYGLEEATYNALAPYILIPEKISKEFKKDSLYAKKPFQVREMDINTASFYQLIKVEGIDTSLVWSIINYRKLLGGFCKKEQLTEVVGLNTEMYNRIISRVFINKNAVSQININTCSVKKLKTHPYLTSNQANSIVNYRLKNGIYKTIDEIKKSDLIDDITFLKISPYLTLSE